MISEPLARADATCPKIILVVVVVFLSNFLLIFTTYLVLDLKILIKTYRLMIGARYYCKYYIYLHTHTHTHSLYISPENSHFTNEETQVSFSRYVLPKAIE